MTMEFRSWVSQVVCDCVDALSMLSFILFPSLLVLLVFLVQGINFKLVLAAFLFHPALQYLPLSSLPLLQSHCCVYISLNVLLSLLFGVTYGTPCSSPLDNDLDPPVLSVCAQHTCPELTNQKIL